MTDTDGTIQAALLAVSRILEPLQRELSPGRAQPFFSAIGIDISSTQENAISAPLASTIGTARDMLQLASDLVTAIEGGDPVQVISKSSGLVQKIGAAIQSIDAIVAAVQALGLGIPPAVIDSIPERVFNLLLFNFFAEAPGVNELLALLGILELQTPPNPPATFHFGRIGDWIRSPGSTLTALYQWNDPAFDGIALLDRLTNLLVALGAPVSFDKTATPPSLDIILVSLTPKTDVTPKGLALNLRASINPGTKTFVEDEWSVQLALAFGLPIQSALVLQPTGLSFIPPSTTDTYSGKTTISAIADRTQATDAYVIVGQPGGSRLEVRKIEVDAGGSLTWDGTRAQGTLDIGATVSGGKLAIAIDESDGFLGKILSGVNLDASFDLGLGYSSDRGLYFIGSSTLAIQLPLHLDLGPIAVSALTFSVGVAGQAFPIVAAADLSATLGPLEAVVQEIGVEVDVALKDDRSGNAGPLDLGIAFKPPKGVGISVDTGVVKGGGFLAFDPAKGEYSGAAELSIADLVTVKAIGLITTQKPDGSKGFSLLLVISADFTPIQLGFGFTLNGVGGLLAVDRAVLLDVLRAGMRTGVADAILFPGDVIANAPRIITNLETMFPMRDATFLVGPVGKFGWGTPSLITLSLGIIVEIPPGNIALVGLLQIALPDASDALLAINVNFLGTLEFDKQLLSFDASLFDSHLLFIVLDGDLAVRIKWGDNSAFLLSAGGFHPSFHPPPLDLPALRRLTFSILDTDAASIKVQAYFAVTSNTVQFGAHADLFFGVDGCDVSGRVGFDVLFQFSPFYFNALISGSLNLHVAGLDLMSIGLDFSLEGPTPWRAKGKGSISILFFSIDVDFDVSWGDPKDTSLPSQHVLPLFLAEMNKDANWRAMPPAYGQLFVSIRKLEGLFALHPIGALIVSQRALPLNLVLDKVGNQKPDDVNKVDISAAASNGGALALTNNDEEFAIAQFQDLSDADKLSRPSYQPLKGGVVVGDAAEIASSKMTRRQIEYAVTIVDKDGLKPKPKPPPLRATGVLFDPLLEGAAVARSTVSFARKRALSPFDDGVVVASEPYAVASVTDNRAIDTSSTYASEAKAIEAMKLRLAADPSLAGALHVLPISEVNAA
jgi:hypothetical protein